MATMPRMKASGSGGDWSPMSSSPALCTTSWCSTKPMPPTSSCRPTRIAPTTTASTGTGSLTVPSSDQCHVNGKSGRSCRLEDTRRASSTTWTSFGGSASPHTRKFCSRWHACTTCKAASSAHSTPTFGRSRLVCSVYAIGAASGTSQRGLVRSSLQSTASTAPLPATARWHSGIRSKRGAAWSTTCRGLSVTRAWARVPSCAVRQTRAGRMLRAHVRQPSDPSRGRGRRCHQA